MSARIFISYRSADGTDKATALARDLGRRYGDDQVFLDKDDLRGGEVWRREVAHAIEQRPVLLLLVTPQTFGARNDQGQRRIGDPDDPVRREVETALAHDAHLIPVLCDGVDGATALVELPPPFDRLGERTWRNLRARDWEGDLQRLVDDLDALGVRPAPSSARRLMLGGLMAGAATLSILAWFARRPSGLNGRWRAKFTGETVTVLLRHEGERLQFESVPIDVRERADWADYRAFWRRTQRSELERVRYRGDGTASTPTGTALTINLDLQVLSVPGDMLIDSGKLSATLSPDGQRLEGRRWLNSAQAQTPVTLTRLDAAGS